MTEGQTFSSGTLLPWIGWRQGQEGGGASIAAAGPFELAGGATGYAVTNCRLAFGRTELKCPDTAVNMTAPGFVVADVSHGPKPTLSVKKFLEVPENSLTRTFRTLYEVKDDGTVVDYRYMPVVVAAN